jgi:hypothetical protein
MGTDHRDDEVQGDQASDQHHNDHPESPQPRAQPAARARGVGALAIVSPARAGHRTDLINATSALASADETDPRGTVPLMTPRL